MLDDFTPDSAYAEVERTYREWRQGKSTAEVRQAKILATLERVDKAGWPSDVVERLEERLRKLAACYNLGTTVKPLPTYMGGKRQGPSDRLDRR